MAFVAKSVSCTKYASMIWAIALLYQPATLKHCHGEVGGSDSIDVQTGTAFLVIPKEGKRAQTGSAVSPLLGLNSVA